MAKRIKQTALQKEYTKQISRIKRFVQRAEKRGYEFPADVVPKQLTRPTRKSIERLKQIKPKELYKKAEYIDYDTGEVITGTERRRQERQEAYQKGRRKVHELSFGVADTVRGWIQQLPDVRHVYDRSMRRARGSSRYVTLDIAPYKEILLGTIDDQISTKGEAEYEAYLKQNEYTLFTNMELIANDSEADDVKLALSKVVDIIAYDFTFSKWELDVIGDIYGAVGVQ